MSKSEIIQQSILDWFKGITDEQVKDFIGCYLYRSRPKLDTTSKLVEKFLSENGLALAYCSAHMDMKDEREGNNRAFLRTSMSDREMLQMVEYGLFNLGYWRWAKSQPAKLDKPKAPKMPSIHTVYTDGVEKIHATNPLGEEYSLCMDLLDGDEVVSYEVGQKKINCENCLRLIKHSKKH